MTELEQFRAMLNRIEVTYTERGTEDWERPLEPTRFQTMQDVFDAFEQKYNKPWVERTDEEHAEFFPRHTKPGWTSLFPNIGYIETELIFDPDGNLHGFEQHE